MYGMATIISAIEKRAVKTAHSGKRENSSNLCFHLSEMSCSKQKIGSQLWLYTVFGPKKTKHLLDQCTSIIQYKLESVEGPVIQANGRLTFEDDLRSGGLLYFTTQ